MISKRDTDLVISRIVTVCSLLAMFIGVIVLAGWIFDLPLLTTFDPQWPIIKANTSLGIIAGSCSLLLFLSKKRAFGFLLAIFIFLLGTLSLSEYIFHWDAQIDELLFTDKLTAATAYPGRMAIFTTFAVIVTGLSLISYTSKIKWVQRFSELSVILLFTMSFAGFLASLYNARQLSQMANLTSFSMPTASAGLLLSIAILFSKKDSGIVAIFYKQTNVARTGIKGVLIIIIMFVLISWICLKGEKEGLFTEEAGLVVMNIAFFISFMIVLLAGIRRLNVSEHQLKTSEKKLKQVLSSYGDVFYVIDKNYKITIINEKAEQNLSKAWGRSVKLGDNILNCIPRETDEPIQSSFEKVFSGERIEYELHLSFPDLPDWVSVSYTPVKGDDGTIIGAYVVTKDITEKKRAEEKINESYRRLEMLAATTHDALWEWNLETNEMWSNNVHQQLYGLSHDDPVPTDKMWRERIHPEDRETVVPDLEKTLASSDAGIWISEYRFLTPSGYRYIYDRSYIVRNKNGEPIRTMGSMIDITDRKQAEEALAKSESYLRTIIQTEPECVKLVNSNGELQDMNQAGLEMIEAESLEQVQGRPISSIVNEPYRTAFENLTQNIFQGKSGTLEFEITGLKGATRWLETHAVPLKDNNGKIISLLGVTRDITKRKEALEELELSEERYRSLIEQASDAIMITDTLGNFLDVNSSLCDMFGYDKEELLRTNIRNLIDPKQLKKEPMRFDRLVKGEHVFSQRGMVHKNGTVIEVEANVKMLPDGRVLAIARDITERKRAERLIRDSEEIRRLIMDSALDAIIGMDTNGVINIWTPQAEKIFGWSQKEIIGRSLADTIIPERYREKHRKGLRNYIKSGSGPLLNRLVEISALRDDGTEFPIELSIVSVKQGDSEFFCAFVRDITERKKAEEIIVRERDLSDSIINSLPGIFYLRNLQTGKCIRWNKNFEKDLKYSAEEISQSGLYDHLAEEDRRKVKLALETAIRDGYAAVEANVITKDGDRVPYYITGTIINYEDQICIMGTGIDISARKKAEKELDQSYQAIRKLTEHLQNVREEERTHIAREIHDELGQQLTVLKMDASWLNKKLSSSDESIKQKLNDLLELLDGTVRTVRKISSELRPSLLDDMGLVPAMEWHLKEFGKRTSLKTNFSIPSKELQLSETVRTGLFRIFQESLTNVARHANAKKVDVSLEQQNGNIILSIKDDGSGFDKWKAANKKTLGILGMKERSFMMGGSYKVESKPGKGTLVTVSVPYPNR